jgi:hypothetical protein
MWQSHGAQAITGGRVRDVTRHDAPEYELTKQLLRHKVVLSVFHSFLNQFYTKSQSLKS